MVWCSREIHGYAQVRCSILANLFYKTRPCNESLKGKARNNCGPYLKQMGGFSIVLWLFASQSVKLIYVRYCNTHKFTVPFWRECEPYWVFKSWSWTKSNMLVKNIFLLNFYGSIILVSGREMRVSVYQVNNCSMRAAHFFLNNSDYPSWLWILRQSLLISVLVPVHYRKPTQHTSTSRRDSVRIQYWIRIGAP